MTHVVAKNHFTCSPSPTSLCPLCLCVPAPSVGCVKPHFQGSRIPSSCTMLGLFHLGSLSCILGNLPLPPCGTWFSSYTDCSGLPALLALPALSYFPGGHFCVPGQVGATSFPGPSSFLSGLGMTSWPFIRLLNPNAPVLSCPGLIWGQWPYPLGIDVMPCHCVPKVLGPGHLPAG